MRFFVDGAEDAVDFLLKVVGNAESLHRVDELKLARRLFWFVHQHIPHELFKA
jgi:hypothetical protein